MHIVIFLLFNSTNLKATLFKKPCSIKGNTNESKRKYKVNEREEGSIN